jgi:hypothetical protein
VDHALTVPELAFLVERNSIFDRYDETPGDSVNLHHIRRTRIAERSDSWNGTSVGLMAEKLGFVVESRNDILPTLNFASGL